MRKNAFLPNYARFDASLHFLFKVSDIKGAVAKRRKKVSYVQPEKRNNHKKGVNLHLMLYDLSTFLRKILFPVKIFLNLASSL